MVALLHKMNSALGPLPQSWIWIWNPTSHEGIGAVKGQGGSGVYKGGLRSEGCPELVGVLCPGLLVEGVNLVNSEW